MPDIISGDGSCCRAGCHHLNIVIVILIEIIWEGAFSHETT